MKIIYLMLTLCTDMTCADSQAFIMDKFEAHDVADAYADCIRQRDAGRLALRKATAPGVRRLDCTPADSFNKVRF